MDSKAEAGRYIQLLLLERERIVFDIVPHPRYELLAFNVDSECDAVGHYTADFSYLHVNSNTTIYEDVKGQVPRKNTRTGKWTRPRGWSEFQLRLRIMKANYGIDVIVIPNTQNVLTKIYESRHLYKTILKGIQL